MRYLILFILLVGPIHLIGQESKDYPIKENRVIAIPGLNMRAQPNLTAKKISFIPFGKEVQILDPKKLHKDTVGEIENYRRDVLRHRYPNPVIDGYWIKARYRGKTGYVFSAYLIDYRRQERQNKKMEEKNIHQDYVLLFEGAYCRDNTHYQKDWHYYAAQRTEEGICLVPIKMSFVKNISSGYANLHTRTNVSEFDPKFIIGSHQPLSTNQMVAKVDIPYYQLGASTTKYLVENLPSNLQIRSKGKRLAPELVLNQNGKSQVLNPFMDPEKTERNRLNFIHFIGDLDGDGQDDYIIQFGEKYSQTVLYLSSEAGSNEIIKPVAIWYSGYCC